jgi:hypothetical protein
MALSAFRVQHPWPGKPYDVQQRKMRGMEAYRHKHWLRVPGGWRHDVYWDEGARLHLLGGACERARRHAAAMRIQAARRAAVSDPGHATCRRRLQREYEELAL